MHHYVLNSVPKDHPSQHEALAIIRSVNETLQANRDSFTEEDWDADDDAVQWKLDDMAYYAIPENLKMLDSSREFVEGGGISWDTESAFYAGQVADKATWVLFQLLKVDDGLGWRFHHASDVSDPALGFADLDSVFAKWLTLEDEVQSKPNSVERHHSIGDELIEIADNLIGGGNIPRLPQIQILSPFYQEWNAVHGETSPYGEEPTTEGMTGEELQALQAMTTEQRVAFCQILQKMCEEPPSTWREELKKALVIFISGWFGLEEQPPKSGNVDDNNSLDHTLQSLTDAQKAILARTLISFHRLGGGVGEARFREVSALFPPMDFQRVRMSGQPPFWFIAFA